MQSRKRKSQVENFLHFEESPEQFPIEFCLTFGGNYEKYAIDHFAKSTFKEKKAIDTYFILEDHKKIKLTEDEEMGDNSNVVVLPRIEGGNE